MPDFFSLYNQQERFQSFLKFEKRYSPHTVLAYVQDVSSFFTFLKNELNVQDDEPVDHIPIRAWLISLMEQGLQARSLHRKIASLRAFFQFLIKNGELTQNPMNKVSVPKAGKRLPVIVQESELKTLFEEVDWHSGFPALRDKAVLSLLYGAGLRRSELVGLQTSDFDPQSERIRILGKGGKERLIPIPPFVVKAVMAYLQSRQVEFPDYDQPFLVLTNKGNPIYPNLVYLIVRKYLGLVTTLEKRSPHVLRHSYATHLSNSGAELNAVKELLGHSSLAATQIYMHNSIERLKEVYTQAHPKAQKGKDE
jgi:integrase/recombinase XerC